MALKVLFIKIVLAEKKYGGIFMQKELKENDFTAIQGLNQQIDALEKKMRIAKELGDLYSYEKIKRNLRLAFRSFSRIQLSYY